MENKEKNFISAVVYLHNDVDDVIPFFKNVNDVLDRHFEKYEIIAVDDACSDKTIDNLREWAKNLQKPLTIVHMSLYHGKEDAMNAGLDAAIGDYVFEFDSVQMPYERDIIFDAYKTAIEGNDIVCICPSQMASTSKLFYNIFNRSSGSKYELQTDSFRLVTRRAINRVHASSSFMPYRKAAYAASGLKMISISYDGKVVDSGKGRINLAIDSLALYTNAGFKMSICITSFMAAVALAALVYTIIIYCTGKPIAGWTTTMLVMTFGFLGLFVILSILIKYASLNLDMSFRKQKYLIESIEKIQK